MRTLVFFTCLLLVTSLVFAQPINDDDNFFNYTYDKTLISKKKIETITIKKSIFEKNKVNERKFDSSLYFFDKNGLLKKILSYNTLNSLRSETYFFTNENGELIKRKTIDHEYKTSDSTFIFRTYKDGKMISDSSSSYSMIEKFSYNENGMLLTKSAEVNFGESYKNKRLIKNTLDKMGHIINITETVNINPVDTNGVVLSKRFVSYNSRGKIKIEKETIDYDNPAFENKGIISYKYNRKGKLIAIESSKASSHHYKYNKKGLISQDRMTINFNDHLIVTTDKYYYIFWK